jgi:hypothetical protein
MKEKLDCRSSRAGIMLPKLIASNVSGRAFPAKILMGDK